MGNSDGRLSANRVVKKHKIYAPQGKKFLLLRSLFFILLSKHFTIPFFFVIIIRYDVRIMSYYAF